MNIEQCASELANLLRSGQPPSAHQMSALINSCLRGSGARQMDLKRHQLAVAFKGMVPESEHRDLICGEYCPTIIDGAGRGLTKAPPRVGVSKTEARPRRDQSPGHLRRHNVLPPVPSTLVARNKKTGGSLARSSWPSTWTMHGEEIDGHCSAAAERLLRGGGRRRQPPPNKDSYRFAVVRAIIRSQLARRFVSGGEQSR
jgi:hypothetical protein